MRRDYCVERGMGEERRGREERRGGEGREGRGEERKKENTLSYPERRTGQSLFLSHPVVTLQALQALLRC